MTNNSIPSFSDMLDVLSRNPLKAIQLAGKAHRGVNQQSYEVASIVCGFARVLIDDEKHRGDFYDEELFDDLKRFHPSKILLHVFAYVYGALSGPSYNRASEHARALKKVCGDRAIDVGDIPQYIADHGGFDGLLSEQEDQQDDEDGAVAEAPAGLRDSGRTLGDGIMQRAAANIPAVTSGRNDSDDDGDVGEELFAPPKRKATSLDDECSKPNLKLLPREMLAEYMLARPRAPLKIEDIWQALRDGKKVTAELAMGKVSEIYELYNGGGPFIDVFIEEAAFG